VLGEFERDRVRDRDNLLRDHARQTQAKLVDLAEAVVAGHPVLPRSGSLPSERDLLAVRSSRPAGISACYFRSITRRSPNSTARAALSTSRSISCSPKLWRLDRNGRLPGVDSTGDCTGGERTLLLRLLWLLRRLGLRGLGLLRLRLLRRLGLHQVPPSTRLAISYPGWRWLTGDASPR
jgi:hypothetical protein